MAIIAAKAPDIEVTVVDKNSSRIDAWNSDSLPVFEPGLSEIVKSRRGKNLHFETDVAGAIGEADIIFVAVNTPTKDYGYGARSSADLRYVESVARTISEAATGPKIIVEKSTVPVKTSEVIKDILNSNGFVGKFQVLSNPEFLAEGTAVSDLLNPDRVLIGGESTTEGQLAVETLASIYNRWVPRSRIITTNLWSSELSKLVANAFLAQRISSINSISALCEATGADVDEVANAIGHDSRIGSKFLKASIGFGGSCFQKDILNLVYLCRSLGLPDVASYWKSVVEINDWQKRRFAGQIVQKLHNTAAGKRIAVLGFAFKKDTNDTRETPARSLCQDLLAEQAEVVVYDPRVTSSQIHEELSVPPFSSKGAIIIAESAYEAAIGAHAIVIATDWDEFRQLDLGRIYSKMAKPALLFDGRNILDLVLAKGIGFRVFAIGKTL